LSEIFLTINLLDARENQPELLFIHVLQGTEREDFIEPMEERLDWI